MYTAGPSLARLYALLAVVGLLFFASCSGDHGTFSYEKPPAGWPDTPYWFPIRDTVFCFTAADSLALVQMVRGKTETDKSAALMAIRKLGWRMSVERTGGLSRPGDAQDLSQQVFVVERVDDAVNPVSHYGKFHQAFWEGKDTTLLAWLPGLSIPGQPGAAYYWPSNLIVVWKPGMTEMDARKLIDSLGFEITTPMGLAYQYWVERAWSLELPAGSDLFTWLRWFNRDPRVHLAHPVIALREPPVPDERILRKYPPASDSLIPANFIKLNPRLLFTWEIAQFCGHADLVQDNTGVEARGQEIHVRMIPFADSTFDITALVNRVGGELVDAKTRDAWIPYRHLVDCANDSHVQRIEEVAANLIK